MSTEVTDHWRLPDEWRRAVAAEFEDLARQLRFWAQARDVPRSPHDQSLAQSAAARAIGAQEALLWLLGRHEQRPGNAVRVAFRLARLAAPDPMCVCDHPLSSHELRGGVMACRAEGCACGPGCIHDGFVDKDAPQGGPRGA